MFLILITRKFYVLVFSDFCTLELSLFSFFFILHFQCKESDTLYHYRELALGVLELLNFFKLPSLKVSLTTFTDLTENQRKINLKALSDIKY